MPIGQESAPDETVAPDRSDRLQAIMDRFGGSYTISGENGKNRRVVFTMPDGLAVPGNGVNTEAAMSDLESKIDALVAAGIAQENA